MPGIRFAVGAALLAALLAPIAAAADRGGMGACAAFVRKLDERGRRAGITRPDLFEGLSGWISMKARVKPEDVQGAARRASPDAEACSEIGLEPQPLLLLESIVKNVPPARLASALEGCIAALKVVDEFPAAGREAAKAAAAKEHRTLVKLLGYLAQDRKPAQGAVESQAAALRKEGSDLRNSALFGSAIASCGPLGMDVAILAKIRAAL